MSRKNTKKAPVQGDYEVGYSKPPVHSRFKEGQSGNPSGRPRGITAGRAGTILLKEAYRPLKVREGENVVTLPALQAVLRSHVALAAKGDRVAQRELFRMVQALEHALAEAPPAMPANDDQKPIPPEMTQNDIARRIAYVLHRAQKKKNAGQA